MVLLSLVPFSASMPLFPYEALCKPGAHNSWPLPARAFYSPQDETHSISGRQKVQAKGSPLGTYSFTPLEKAYTDSGETGTLGLGSGIKEGDPDRNVTRCPWPLAHAFGCCIDQDLGF